MTAPRVIDALRGVSGPVQVVGPGALALEVRRLLGERLQTGAEGACAAVVETTGDPAAVAAALQHVDTLGTVVLAGRPPQAPLSLDLYSDLHVRGLILVGVAPESD